MNEELIAELGDAMKRREKAQAAIARWQDQLDDANEDIQELSQRIAAAVTEDPEDDEDDEGEDEPQGEPVTVYGSTANEYETRIFEPVQEP